MKTTIDIPDSLFEEAKRVAQERKTTFKVICDTALRQYLSREKTLGKLFKLRDGSFKGEGLQPGIEEGNWEQIRDMIYEGHGA
jgi:hypothetical protein